MENLYIVEVIYNKEAPLLADQALEEALSEALICMRLSENGIRDGVDGGEECFDIFLTKETSLSYIHEVLRKLREQGIVRDWHIYETDWATIKSYALRIY